MSAVSAYIDDLLFENKLLRDRIAAYECGKEYKKLKTDFDRQLAARDRTIKKLRKDLADARAQIRRVRNMWMQVNEDVEAEKEKALKEADKKIRKAEERAAAAEERAKEARQKLHEKNEELYAVKTQLEEEKGKNQELLSRVHKDYSNSSKPSSMSPNHKTIHNSREKSGRKPGGQPGHIHHGRKRQEPTELHEIKSPKFEEDPDYEPTHRIIRKQMIRVRVCTEVIEYWTYEYRNIVTGQRVHAAFPEGYIDDVNYDGTVKALAYMINNDLYTSIEKTRSFLKDVSDGKIDLSTGFICNLAKQFSECTKEEREQIFQELMTSDVLHADFTFGRTCGKQSAVMITTTDDGKTLFQGRVRKGDEGVKDTPVEHYSGTLVSDHESAIIKHGSRHQECLAHVKRYAQNEADNEPEKTWGRKMNDWIKSAVGYWHEIDDGLTEYSQASADDYISRFMEILQTAKEEYENEPASKYFREGYNTYKRMEKEPENYVLFLRDPSVPPTNNVAERAGRRYKRKAHQVISFRSQEGSERFCDGLTIMESIRAQRGNLFEELTERFNRKETT